VNKIPISKVINCEVFEEFLSLNRVLQAEKELGANEVLKRLSLNWFNASNILNLYQTYSRLDADHNGTLNKNEFLSYTGNAYDNPALHFTPTAVTRIFEMLLRYSDCNEELDFKAFVDFTLIMSNKESTRSKQFFWNVLNINSIEEGGNGKLSIDVIEYFYRDISHGLIDSGCDAPQFHNIVIEIHDILGCSSSDGITLQDVMTSSQGHTVMLMLLDINTFWAYDNRESLIPSDDDAG
jgi:Ca2+-binding EF-hand superfamily protein